MVVSYVSHVPTRAPIRRISEGRQRWRVLVEAWPECGQVLGRLLFRADATRRWDVERESSTMLRGGTIQEVVARAYDIPDEQLLRVLHSLA